MLKKLLHLLHLPIPIWALLPVVVMAAIPTFYGNLNVPTGGTITDTNAGASCVTTNSSGKFIYNACPATPYPTPFINIVSGSNIVSNPSAGPTPNVAVTNAPTFSGPVTDGVSGTQVTAGNGFVLGNVSTTTSLNTDSGKSCSSVTSSVFGVAFGTTQEFCLDGSGNAGFTGKVSATNFNGSGLTASECVGTDASKNLVSNTNCISSTSGFVQLSPGSQQNGFININSYVGATSFNAGFGTNTNYAMLFDAGNNNAAIGNFGTSTGGVVYFYSNGSGSPFVSYINSSGTYVSGSSAYGATSATVNGAVLASGGIQSGSGNCNAPVTGILDACNTTSVGVLRLGGSTEYGQLDYNNALSHGWAFSCPGGGSCTTKLSAPGGVIWNAPSVTCSSSSSVPCVFTWSCTAGSSGCTSPTQSVPASSNCRAWATSDYGYTYTASYTVSGGSGGVASGTAYGVYEIWPTLSSTTLTIHVTAGSNSGVTPNNSSLTGNGACL